MKNKLLILLLILISSLGYSQNNYKKIYKYNEYQNDWALVKDITGNYGFIDRNGKEVVPTIYSKIEEFKYNEGKYALVKDLTGNHGFIDRNGKEVVPTIYNLKDVMQKI